jgi:hypothetical protein
MVVILKKAIFNRRRLDYIFTGSSRGRGLVGFGFDFPK